MANKTAFFHVRKGIHHLFSILNISFFYIKFLKLLHLVKIKKGSSDLIYFVAYAFHGIQKNKRVWLLRSKTLQYMTGFCVSSPDDSRSRLKYFFTHNPVFKY